MLLIGCEVAVDGDRIASFASTFRRFSPVVIATFGEVIAREAPTIAATLIQALGRSHARGEESIGDALRFARCELLARGLLVAFQIVGHGDGNWLLLGGQ